LTTKTRNHCARKPAATRKENAKFFAIACGRSQPLRLKAFAFSVMIYPRISDKLKPEAPSGQH
jgi:hypothetical protein